MTAGGRETVGAQGWKKTREVISMSEGEEKEGEILQRNFRYCADE